MRLTLLNVDDLKLCYPMNIRRQNICPTYLAMYTNIWKDLHVTVNLYYSYFDKRLNMFNANI